MIKKSQYPRLVEINIFYMVIAFLLITLGARAQMRELYSGLLITEYIIILLPSLLFIYLKKLPVRRFLRLNPLGIKNLILIPLIMVLSYPVSVFFNYIGFMFINAFGHLQANPVPTPANSGELVTGFLIIALTPGICEEVMFKGLVLNGYRELGRKKAIIYSSILFGIFHFNLQNLLGPIYLGIVLGVIFTKTNSLYSSILGHTTNNAIALSLSFILFQAGEVTNTGEVAVEMLGSFEILVTLIVLGIVALISGILGYQLIKLLGNKSGEEAWELGDEVPGEEEVLDPYHMERRSRLETIPLILVGLAFIYVNYLVFFLEV